MFYKLIHPPLFKLDYMCEIKRYRPILKLQNHKATHRHIKYFSKHNNNNNN